MKSESGLHEKWGMRTVRRKVSGGDGESMEGNRNWRWATEERSLSGGQGYDPRNWRVQ